MALKHVYEKHPGQPKIEMVKDHPDKQKHWDMLNDHITEFFPTFFASPVQVKFNCSFIFEMFSISFSGKLETQLSHSFVKYRVLSKLIKNLHYGY